jgi:hypothetical protein
MGGKSHPLGFCNCRNVKAVWNRSRHWTAQEVSYLEQYFGRVSDEHLAEHLGRPVWGIRLKAKRLGIRKRHVGLSASDLAAIFGVDRGTVTSWIDKGLLPARRAYKVGLHRAWLVRDGAVEAFIRDHGQYVDFDKMPDGYYKDLARQHRWYSLTEVECLTGQSPRLVIQGIKGGMYRAAMRGLHFYVAAEELPKVREATDPWRSEHIPVLLREREDRLKRRRDKRKRRGRYREAA